jgi:glycosidase
VTFAVTACRPCGGWTARYTSAVRGVYWMLVGAFVCAACKGDDASSQVPTRACGLTVWYQPSSNLSHVAVLGSWNNWAQDVLYPTRADGWRIAHYDLAPGEYTYAIDDDGDVLANPNVPTTAVRNGQEVTWVDVPNCDVPELVVTGSSGSAAGAASIQATFFASSAGDPLAPSTFQAVDRDGTALPSSSFQADVGAGTIAIATSGLSLGKHVFTLTAQDTGGRIADEALATVWIEPQPFDPRDTVIYQVVIDRYRNAGGALAPPSFPAGRAGGTVDGVLAAIESGELQTMGVNTIWLSPVYANPDGTWPGLDGRPYTSYHGYWPSEPRTLESLQASDASLNLLITSAHAKGIRILFDVVPHHVHELHPYFVNYKNDGWFLHPDGSCICGTTCSWATDILDCAFATYLPTLDWTNPAVADQGSSDIVWWLNQYDADGIRIDAVPMMPRSATRRIVNAVRGRFDNPGHSSFLLGENFTGDFNLLRYELGPFGLDSEFNFPLMWTLRSVVAQGSGGMSDIDATVQEGLTAWAGSGAVMTLMLGDQDVSRFSSVSAGDDGGDTWIPAPQSTDPIVYAKQALALGLVFTLPGAPMIFYGDEVGLAGKDDPDCRRVMPADSQLSAFQTETRQTVRAVGAAHTCAVALRRGTYRLLYADAETLAFAREAEGADPVIVVATRQPGTSPAMPLPGIPSGNYVDLLSGHQASLGPELTKLDAAPFSVALYVPTASDCAHLAPPSP